MKITHIFSLIIFLFFVVVFTDKGYSQCVAEITTPTQDTSICIGDSVYISAFATCNFLMDNNFNNGSIGSGWSSNANPMFNNPCGAGLPGSGIHCWIGSFTNFPRELVTLPFNIFNGCYIEFEMRYAADENAVDCEDPDEPTEGVHLQYGLPPYSSWVDMNYWTPNYTYTGPLYTWNEYTQVIPAAAFGPSTKIRWYQDVTSGNNWDHWGIDEVEIVCPQSQNIFWSNGPVNTTNQWVSPTVGTEYIIAIFDTLGNMALDTVYIDVIATPSADFNASSPVCVGQNAQISYSGPTPTATTTFTWDFDGGNVVTGSGYGPYEVNWTTPGTYTVTLISDDGGCDNSQQQTVVVNSDLSISILPTSGSVCPDSSITISASGGDSYFWSPSTSLSSDTGHTVIAFPSSSTTYTVSASNTLGCSGTATVTIGIYPDPQITVNAFPASGCEPLVADFAPIVLPGASYYLWNFGDTLSGSLNTSTDEAPTHVFSDPGAYDIELYVISSDGCPGIINLDDFVNVYTFPEAAFSADPITVNLSTPTIYFTDQSLDAFQWLWNFGDIYSISNTSDLQNPSHTYSGEGAYTVYLTVFNEYGCSDSASIRVYVERDIAFYVPNAFTPFNDDGVNDIFQPMGIGVMFENTFTMKIFDRWGKTIFITNDQSQGWDGTINGDDAPPGAYSYFIEVQFSDGLWYNALGKVLLIK